jgi:hypothetical protein
MAPATEARAERVRSARAHIDWFLCHFDSAVLAWVHEHAENEN